MWYACGRLDPAEAEIVEIHLASCDECRSDLVSLRSMGASLRTAIGSGHAACAELVAFHNGDCTLPATVAVRIAEHVEVCASCRAELATLDHASVRRRRRWSTGATLADSRPPVLRAAGSSWSRRAHRMLAAAAMVLVVLTWPVRPLTPTAVFTPALRGADVARRLSGLGPWRLSVFLPTQAIEAEYAIRIRGPNAGDGPVYDGIGRFGPAAPAIVEVPSFPKPGRYVLEMEAKRDGEGMAHAYPFEVVSAP